jgi:hypothetical protein
LKYKEEKGKNSRTRKFIGGGGVTTLETESINPTRVEEEKSVAKYMEVDQSARK